MGIADTSIAAVAALFSGAAAVASWRSSREANRTADSVAQIERDRWHRELTPVLRFAVTRERGYQELLMKYKGPAALGPIRLELAIRDDRIRAHDPLLAGAYTAEEVANTIWGPYRFRHSANGADAIGRTVEPIDLEVQEQWRLGLDPTHPPRDYSGGREGWQDKYQSEKFRLWIHCHAEGHKPWRLSADLDHPDVRRWVTAA